MPIVEKLNHEITKILQEPALKAAWAKQGATPLTMTQPQFATFMQAQVDKWAKVIKANHIHLIN
jgi:tripartite-type tricarboxylate transporter receptor subunit TctC